jgi:Flp pilus assembly protein TadD
MELRMDPTRAYNSAFMLQQQGRYEEAVEQYLALLKLEPRAADALCNCGVSLMQLGKLDEAETFMRRALALDVRSLAAWNDLALLHQRAGRNEQAVALAREGLRRADSTHLRNTLGLAHQYLGNYEKAADFFRRAIQLDGANAAAHFNLASLLLAQGRFAEGWREYAWRPQRATARSALAGVRWLEVADLGGVAGKSVQLVGEQGLGDELFLMRFAGGLLERGARLSYRGDSRIGSLLAPRIAVASGNDGTADYCALLGDLPALLGADSTPAPLALAPRAERVAKAASHLAGAKAPFLGVTWAAGPTADAQRARDLGVLHKRISAEALGAALRGCAATLVVLQRAPLREDVESLARAFGGPLIDLSSLNDDLEDMLGLLATLDEYAGVSNTNMHLRAAAGRPARVLVQWPPEWRYGVAGSATPWFPQFRLYRETARAGWGEALQALANDLKG